MNSWASKRLTTASSKRRIVIIDSSVSRLSIRAPFSGVLSVAAPEQVGRLQQLGPLLELARRAGEAQLAALHHVRVVGQPERQRRELLDQQHADARLGHRADRRYQPLHD